MENASKALIIAGAILLSILIIGLGMFIYNQAASQVSDANLNTEEAQAFNNKFLSYTGKNKYGDEVKRLIDTVIANNNTTTDDIQIKYKNTKTSAEIDFTRSSNKITQIRSQLVNSTKYTVNVTSYDSATGKIKIITIEGTTTVNAPT